MIPINCPKSNRDKFRIVMDGFCFINPKNIKPALDNIVISYPPLKIIDHLPCCVYCKYRVFLIKEI
jgi:hypothetical protein